VDGVVLYCELGEESGGEVSSMPLNQVCTYLLAMFIYQQLQLLTFHFLSLR
jgi:hypothetical protein